MGVDRYLESMWENRGGSCTRKHCDEGKCLTLTPEQKKQLEETMTAQRLGGFRDGLDFAIRAAHRNKQSAAYIAYLEEVRRSELK